MAARSAVVTGASRGIGVYIADALAPRGLDLLPVARSEAELERVAAAIRSRGTTVAIAAIDLTDPDAPQRVADAAGHELGAVDVLVNNAALELQRRFHLLTRDDVEAVLRVDLIAPIELTRLLLPQMPERGYGRIVSIA